LYDRSYQPNNKRHIERKEGGKEGRKETSSKCVSVCVVREWWHEMIV
jgi:hypothetical protein